MQWPLGLASLLWVWQFPHYHLSLSFSRAFFLHFGWPSRISLLQSMVQHELLILLDLFSGVCTVQRVAYWVYYASPFFLWLFPTLARTVLFPAWKFYSVLSSVLGVFSSTFFSCINYHSFRIVYFWFFDWVIPISICLSLGVHHSSFVAVVLLAAYISLAPWPGWR